MQIGDDQQALFFPKQSAEQIGDQQRELRPSITMEVNYVGTAGRKLFRAQSVNRVPGARLPEGTCVTDTFGRKLCSQVDSNLASNGIEIIIAVVRKSRASSRTRGMVTGNSSLQG